MKATSSYFKLVLLFTGLLLGCQENDKGFFSEMPTTFIADSLVLEKDLFNVLHIEHLAENKVRINAEGYCEILPFCGVLKAAQDTIFFSETEHGDFRPYLILTGSKFDTLQFKYSGSREDQVVSMGRMSDDIFKDSVTYFQLIPISGRGPFHNRFVRYIALKRNVGIRYLTFRSNNHDYTILLSKYPKVVWSSND